MSGQEMTPSGFFASSSRGHPSSDERIARLETKLELVIQKLMGFALRTKGQSEATEERVGAAEEQQWGIFEWIEGADSSFNLLHSQCQCNFEEVTTRLDRVAAESGSGIESLRHTIQQQTSRLENKFDGEEDKLKRMIEMQNKVCLGKINERAQVEASEREGILQRMTSIVEDKLTGIESKIQDNAEALVGNIQATLLEVIQEQGLKIGMLESKVNVLGDELSKATLVPTPTVTAPPVVAPIVPPAPFVPHRVSNVRWSRNLSKLTHKEVRNFVSMFKSYQAASGMTNEELKLTLLQSLDGEALQLVSAIAETSSVDELLERLLNRVKPSQSVLLRKLMDLKQKIRESVYDFGARFQLISSELPAYSDSRIRDILIECLNDSWRMTARSIVMHDSHISVENLLGKLCELEGIDAADRMEIDHLMVQKRLSTEEKDVSYEIGQVVMNGRINWSEVQDGRSLLSAWKQMIRSDNAFRNHCLGWLNHKPNPQTQRNGFRNNQQYRPRPFNQNRRIFNVNEQPEPNYEIVEDEVFEETENVCASSQVVRNLPIKVLHKSSNTQSRKPQTSPTKRIQGKSYLAAATSGLKNPPLMFMRAKLNGNACDALIDTGSQLSILPFNKTKRWGIPVDQSKKQLLCGFDGAKSESVGMANIEVNLGNEVFIHEFCVIPSPKAKLIFGNDLMKAQQLLVDPASHQAQLKNNLVVPCHHVDNSKSEIKPSCSSHEWRIKSVEPLVVHPVVKDDVLLIPAGKSFALGARSARTMILPFTTSRTTQIVDVNRLPPGVITNAGV